MLVTDLARIAESAIRCRIGDPSTCDPAHQRLVATDDPTILATVARVAGTRGSVLLDLWFDPEAWAGKNAEMLAYGEACRTGERAVRVAIERTIEPREIRRRRTDLGLYWFECYLPWIPVPGKADIAAVDTWGAVMELSDLVDLAHQALSGVVPTEWASAVEVVESFVNTAEIASRRFYPEAHVVVVQLGADADVRRAFGEAQFVRWGGRVARVVHYAPDVQRVWLDVTPPEFAADSRAWTWNGLSWAHELVVTSVPVDQRHNLVATKARVVQSWMNLDGYVDSPTHYPNSWSLVIDASLDPEIKSKLDAGIYRAVSFHATMYQIPTVYPAEVVQVALDPYGGRFDQSRDAQSR